MRKVVVGWKGERRGREEGEGGKGEWGDQGRMGGGKNEERRREKLEGEAWIETLLHDPIQWFHTPPEMFP